VNGSANEHQVGILGLKPLDCPGPAMPQSRCRQSRKLLGPAGRAAVSSPGPRDGQRPPFRFWLHSDRRVLHGGRPGRRDRPRPPAACIRARFSSADGVVWVTTGLFGSVFSSAERTNLLGPSLRPFQMRWYKSRMRPALDSKSGSRGKIQQRCCQGRMAFSLSHCQTVVSLRDAVRPQARTWAPSSATLQRERGTPKRVGNSQAIALTCTTSSGGKNPGAAGALAVLQTCQTFFEESFSPAADDLASSAEAIGNLIVRKALRSEEIILARATIKYGNVYLFARCCNSSRSCFMRTILYGLLRDKLVPSRQQDSRSGRSPARNLDVIVFLK
jgi:hypothetical protein